MTPLPDEINIFLRNEAGFGNQKSLIAGTGWRLLLVFAIIIAFVSGTAVKASSQINYLKGSNFEIDLNANLVVDGAPPSIDWAHPSVLPPQTQIKEDAPTGPADDSFGHGSKEDTEVPAPVSGSIPPNKSDLKHFGIYVESDPNGDYLHMFWTRVQDPSGTTNMDFEFNRNKCDPTDLPNSVCSANGVTPVRSLNDLLIVYELSKGGTVPVLATLRWIDATNAPTHIPKDDCESSSSFPCWGARQDLNDPSVPNDPNAKAIGSINTSAIALSDSAGLHQALGPRTFGEASIDLGFILDPNKCEGFGSVYLKSRSSDSFDSALKDYIAPISTTIGNCGTVVIRKQTDPDGSLGTFYFNSDLDTDPYKPPNFSLVDGGVKSFSGNVISDKTYTVTEQDPTLIDFDLIGIDCSLSVPSDLIISTSLASRSVVFDMIVNGYVDCTFTNQKRSKIIVHKYTSPPSTDPNFGFQLTGGPDSINQEFYLKHGQSHDSSYIKPTSGTGTTYSVAETSIPYGWELDVPNTTCTSDLSGTNYSPNAIELIPGDTVHCTFTNLGRGAIKIIKTAKNKSLGSGEYPLAGVDFQVKDNGGTLVDTVTTGSDGTVCIDNLFAGQVYSVTEVLPVLSHNYDPNSPNPQYVTVTAGATCSSGTPDEVNFNNIPLSKVNFTFYSKAGSGVTTATIQCEDIHGAPVNLPNGSPISIDYLQPGEYNCTIVIDP